MYTYIGTPELDVSRSYMASNPNLNALEGFVPSSFSVHPHYAMAAGLLLCVAWYYTILAGFYILYCPVMYIMFFHHKLYRIIVDTLFALWEMYAVALFQSCFGTQLHHYGDYVNPDERTIIIMNHRTRVDWNYVWIALYHANQHNDDESCICKQINNKNTRKTDTWKNLARTAKIKFVLKDDIKRVPGIGWIMQLNYFLYVKRNWSEDQLSLTKFVAYYNKLDYPCRLVLFPEGTDLSLENQKRNQRYAETHKLQEYEYVLHPRTTGWAALCAQLRSAGLESVYDVTVAYDIPAQTEYDLLCGRIPLHVYFHFKRYSIDELPDEEESLRLWLNNCWSSKEIMLRKFHLDGYFIDPITSKASVERAPRSLRQATYGFLFWTVIDVTFIYLLTYSVIFRFWVIYHSLLFAFVTWHFGGFQNIQYKLLHKSN